MLRQPSFNSDRLSSDLLRALNLIFTREVRNERLRKITVTKVIVSSNKKTARVYVQVFNNEHYVIKQINAIKKYIKGSLSRYLSLSYVPELYFYPDKSLVTAQRIDELLDQ